MVFESWNADKLPDLSGKHAIVTGANSGLAMERRARELLDPRVNEALRNQFASRTVQEVVAGRGGALPDEALDPSAVSTGELMNGTTSAAEEAEAATSGEEDAAQAQQDPDAGSGPPPEKDDQREELMNSVAEEVNAATLEDLGIEVVDVRVKQVDWPEQVRGRVFDRMRAERARDAAEHRARGREVAERIRAAADRERTEILARAYEGAQKMRGEGDARATGIYANAYTKDREFFRFYRSLQAYRDSFNSQDDLLILSPDSEFFRYMKESGGN